jgi:hypothetical protein
MLLSRFTGSANALLVKLSLQVEGVIPILMQSYQFTLKSILLYLFLNQLRQNVVL